MELKIYEDSRLWAENDFTVNLDSARPFGRVGEHRTLIFQFIDPLFFFAQVISESIFLGSAAGDVSPWR